MRKAYGFSWLFILILCSVLGMTAISGCDSGSPSPQADNSAAATVTGTVAGTTIVAYDAATGTEVDRSVAEGDPKIFTLELPVSGSYIIYLIENEGPNQRVYPLYQDATNVFSLNAEEDFTVDLGFVDTTSGQAVPENNPLEDEGVASGGENLITPDDLAGSACDGADLVGDWHFQALALGNSDIIPSSMNVSPFWYRGTITIDEDGVQNIRHETSINPGIFEEATAAEDTIRPSGLILPASGTEGRRILGINKQMIITAYSHYYEDYGFYFPVLRVSQKMGDTTFTTPDLAGSWNYSGIYAVQDWISAGWLYGSVEIDSAGNASAGTTTTSSGERPRAAGVISIDTTGVVSNSNYGSNYSGMMSQDKNLIVATYNYTSVPGPWPREYNVCVLVIYQKVNSAVTFDENDLQGSWYTHSLLSGVINTLDINGDPVPLPAYQQDPKGWGYGSARINGGQITLSKIMFNEAPQPEADYDVSIDVNGIVTLSLGGVTLPFRGVMSSDKTMMVAVSRDGGGDGYLYTIFSR